MLNNDILRRIRHVFDFIDTKMIGLFRSGGTTVTRDQLSVWMKKEEEPEVVMSDDSTFSTFLNGLIIENRSGFKIGRYVENCSSGRVWDQQTRAKCVLSKVWTQALQ
jgi:uncharacterized protein YehS (DUF1456 family)